MAPHIKLIYSQTPYGIMDRNNNTLCSWLANALKFILLAYRFRAKYIKVITIFRFYAVLFRFGLSYLFDNYNLAQSYYEK